MEEVGLRRQMELAGIPWLPRAAAPDRRRAPPRLPQVQSTLRMQYVQEFYQARGRRS